MRRAHTQPTADRLEREGDALMARRRAKAALAKYRAAEGLRATPQLYAKLIRAHAAATRRWTAEDFTASLDWEMRRQAMEHPELVAVHERLSPEWEAVADRARRLLAATDAAAVTRLTEEIAAYGAKAVRPLLDLLCALARKTS